MRELPISRLQALQRSKVADTVFRCGFTPGSPQPLAAQDSTNTPTGAGVPSGRVPYVPAACLYIVKPARNTSSGACRRGSPRAAELRCAASAPVPRAPARAAQPPLRLGPAERHAHLRRRTVPSELSSRGGVCVCWRTLTTFSEPQRFPFPSYAGPRSRAVGWELGAGGRGREPLSCPFSEIALRDLARFEFGRGVPHPPGPARVWLARGGPGARMSIRISASQYAGGRRLCRGRRARSRYSAPTPGEPRRGAVPAGRRQMVSAALAEGPRGEGADGQETLSSSD